MHTNRRGGWITCLFFLTRSCERFDSKVSIEIIAIFVKCLCGATFNDHLKVEPRVVSKGNFGIAILVMNRFCG